MADFIELFPHNINQKHIDHVVQVLRSGGLVILPTDSIYAIAGDLYHKDAMDKLCKLLGKKPNKAELSILCNNLSTVANYTTPIDNSTYKLMNRLLPGPFTFVLKASGLIPNIFKRNKKTIGIRIPDNSICQAVIATLGHPLVSSSIHAEDEIQQYLTEPEQIFEEWDHKADIIISGGIGSNMGTTVIDGTGTELELIREGLLVELV
ncbi:L-threonylcarbamoyladenylate synthase [Bacteroidia bacterium]|jgi:tRNA threonylcarbamoyl adenosine modification protein (Sua5/YciO/YrdC/YwlC family)|nr:L-threonylcarbamoyladenylate synthase [Bacteroidia bacterium]